MTVMEEIFKGKSVVFTGKLSSVPRKKAQQIVRHLKGSTPSTVRRNLNYLVVGEEGYLQAIEKSHKLNRAEQINQDGGQIQIVTESAFLKMVGLKPKEELKKSLYAGRDITGKFGLNRAQLQYLERWGVIRSFHRTNADTYYDFRALSVMRRVSIPCEQSGLQGHLSNVPFVLIIEIEQRRAHVPARKALFIEQVLHCRPVLPGRLRGGKIGQLDIRDYLLSTVRITLYTSLVEINLMFRPDISKSG